MRLVSKNMYEQHSFQQSKSLSSSLSPKFLSAIILVPLVRIIQQFYSCNCKWSLFKMFRFMEIYTSISSFFPKRGVRFPTQVILGTAPNIRAKEFLMKVFPVSNASYHPTACNRAEDVAAFQRDGAGRGTPEPRHKFCSIVCKSLMCSASTSRPSNQLLCCKIALHMRFVQELQKMELFSCMS